MNNSNDKNTMQNESTSINNRRFDRFLSEIYGAASTTRYKQIPRTNSFNETDAESEMDTKDSTSASKINTNGISDVATHFRQCVAPEPVHNSELNRKLIYSRHLSRSTSFLQIVEEAQKNIIYNWSGIKEIAREAQVMRPNTVNQLVRLVRTATSKVSLKNTISKTVF
jgi:hypothetical protein